MNPCPSQCLRCEVCKAAVGLSCVRLRTGHRMSRTQSELGSLVPLGGRGRGEGHSPRVNPPPSQLLTFPWVTAEEKLELCGLEQSLGTISMSELRLFNNPAASFHPQPASTWRNTRGSVFFFWSTSQFYVDKGGQSGFYCVISTKTADGCCSRGLQAVF